MYVCCGNGTQRLLPEERRHFSNNDIKREVGEMSPLLFKLPQLLSQFFRRLVSEPCPSSYALAFCRFSVIS